MSWSRAFKGAVVGTYYWTVNAVEALMQQLEELIRNTKRALEEALMQEQTIQRLRAEVKSESDENQQLWDQVDYLTNELRKETLKRALVNKVRLLHHEIEKLMIQMEKWEMERTKQLQQLEQELEQLACPEDATSEDLEKLTDLRYRFSTLKREWREVVQNYHIELRKIQQENEKLRQQIEAEGEALAMMAVQLPGQINSMQEEP